MCFRATQLTEPSIQTVQPRWDRRNWRDRWVRGDSTSQVLQRTVRGSGQQSVEVCRSRGISAVVRDIIRWHPPVQDLVVTIPLNEVFAGLG